MSFLKRLFGYMAKNWFALAISLSCVVITTVISIYVPQLSRSVINEIMGSNKYENLVPMVLQIMGLTGVLGFFMFTQSYVNGYFSQKVIYDLRNDVFASLQRQSFAFYDKTQTGQLISRATTDVEEIRRFLGMQLTGLVSAILLIVGAFTSMISMSFELTLVSIVVLPFVFASIYFFGKRIRPVSQSEREYYGKLTSVLFENLTGIRVVRAFAREGYEREKFNTPNRNYLDTSLVSAKIRAFHFPLITFLVSLGTVAIFWYGGVEVMHGRLDVGGLWAFSAYLLMLMRPMFLLGMTWGGYQRMVTAGERVFEVMDAIPEVKDNPNAIEMPPVKGHVKFEDVFFGYEKDRFILEDIELDVEPGETVALLGPTGSGKTTIIRLLPRFYDVTSGRITIDGYDVRDVKLDSLRKQMGIVAQETFLFATTIKENIAYGKPDATMEEIIRAAKIAQAHDFIMSLPKGYETIVGERGVTLSGGQQQRVAIARALLMNPKILILDDSTSSVDVDTEYEIQQALEALLKDRTTFVITQRVSTIRNSDKIVIIENGRIVEEGTHESLMAKKGAYYRIYQTLYEAQRPVLSQEVAFSRHKEKANSNEKMEGDEK